MKFVTSIKCTFRSKDEGVFLDTENGVSGRSRVRFLYEKGNVVPGVGRNDKGRGPIVEIKNSRDAPVTSVK